MLMEPLSKFRTPGRDLVSARGQESDPDTDRDALRNWMQMLRKEAENLRSQAAHMNTVAEEAEALAERIERILRGS